MVMVIYLIIIHLFICLFAVEGGGAIHTMVEAWIKFCKFGNNNGCNKEENDVYAGILTIFYSLQQMLIMIVL
jgi:hypothetical protein